MDEKTINYLTMLSIMSAELAVLNSRIIDFLLLDKVQQDKYKNLLEELKKEKKQRQVQLAEYLKKG